MIYKKIRHSKNAVSFYKFALYTEQVCEMKEEDTIKVFEQKKVRTHWDEKEEKWYFSIVDLGFVTVKLLKTSEGNF